MTEQQQSRGARPLVLLKVRSSEWFIAITVFVAAFNDGFAYGAVIQVLPFSLVDRSGEREEDVQFWLSGLLVAFGLALIISAPFTAWHTEYPWNLTLLLGAGILVLARISQGSSNGAVYSVGLPLVKDTVKPSEVGSWMGFVFGGMTGGLLLSPFLAGMVYARAGYFPVLEADLLLRAAMIEKRSAAQWDFDTAGEDSDDLDVPAPKRRASPSRKPPPPPLSQQKQPPPPPSKPKPHNPLSLAATDLFHPPSSSYYPPPAFTKSTSKPIHQSSPSEDDDDDDAATAAARRRMQARRERAAAMEGERKKVEGKGEVGIEGTPVFLG